LFLIPGAGVGIASKERKCLSIPRLNCTFENPRGERLDESDHYFDDRLWHERPPGRRCLKGVILKINPDVQIVDITHGVTPFDLLDGATAIANAYSYFPPAHHSRGGG